MSKSIIIWSYKLSGYITRINVSFQLLTLVIILRGFPYSRSHMVSNLVLYFTSDIFSQYDLALRGSLDIKCTHVFSGDNCCYHRHRSDHWYLNSHYWDYMYQVCKPHHTYPSTLLSRQLCYLLNDIRIWKICKDTKSSDG